MYIDGDVLELRSRPYEEDNMQRMIYELLGGLGMTCNCKGFYYLAYALELVVDNPDRLLLITKWLYPDVARRFKTTPACVERNIRTVIKIAWRRNPGGLEEIAQCSLLEIPTTSRFLSILLFYIRSKRDTHSQSVVCGIKGRSTGP